jgi:hypothetical protein
LSTLASVILTGTAASMPTASIPGRLFFTTDTQQVFRDSGTAWVNVTPTLSAAAITAIQQESYIYAADTGAANAYVVSLASAPTIVAGSLIVMKAAHANTGASTLAVNGASAVAITKNGGTALSGGEISAGQIVFLVYDGTEYQLIGGVGGGGGLPSGSGNEFLATPNGSSGTAALRAIVPADLPVATASQKGIVEPDGTTITIASGVISAVGGGSSVTLQTNGTNNSSQSTLNLEAGSGITLTNPSGGNVLVTASGGGGVPWLNVTNPASVSFSWLNQGGATENVGSASRYLLAPTDGATNQIRGRQVATTESPESVVAGLIPQLNNQNYNACGIYVSDGTKIITLTVLQGGTLQVNECTNFDTFSSTVATTGFGYEFSPVFLKILDDGTNLKFYWSTDGNNFVLLYSQARLSFLASVSYFGYFAESNNSTWTAAALLVSWAIGTS